MRLLFATLLLLFLFTSSVLKAQDYVPVPRENPALYKAAAGIYYGTITGKDAGIKAKYFIHRSFALETQLSQAKTSYDITYHQLYLALLLQPELGMSQLRPFVGIGPGYNIMNFDPGRILENSFVGVLPAGLEYSFVAIPVAVSLDYKVNFVELSKQEFLRLNEDNSMLGFSLKVLLR